MFAGICLLLAFLGLESWFLKILPKSSSQALGAIYPINWNGRIAYATAGQELESNALFWGSAVLLLSAICIHVAERFLNQRAN